MITMLLMQMRSSARVNKLTYPAYEYVMRQTEAKAEKMLQKAQEEARHIVAAAEKTGQKTIQEYTKSATETHGVYLKTVEKFTNQLSEKLEESSHASSAQLEKLADEAIASMSSQQKVVQEKFSSALESVEKTSLQLEGETTEAIGELKRHVTEASTRLIEKLNAEGKQHTQYIHEHLEKAASSAEEQITEYQKARTALLDTHIERLVEDITARVLHKELTLTDHAELARAALADAKEHNLL